MVEIALAYRRAGNQEQFGNAMARIRSAHDSLLDQGLSHPSFWISEASYHALADDFPKTLELLAAAIEGGFISSPRITDDLPVFNDLEGDPEYEAIQTRMIEHLEAERAALGLDPATA
jgi:hypothetical protein